MTPPEILAQLQTATGKPPATLSQELKVLWLSKAGNWHAAHALVEDLPEPNGAWLHAHLHREEGDLANASYWYHQAKQPSPAPDTTISAEWTHLVRHFAEK